MKEIHGRVQAGQVSVEINCDSSQLDEAIRKMDLLIQKAQHAASLGIDLGLVTCAIGAAAMVLRPGKLSRRELFKPWQRRAHER